MAFGSDNKLTIEVTVDSSGAVTGFKNLESAVDDTSEKAQKASGVLDGFFQGFTQGVGIEAARQAIAALSSALGALPDAIARGAAIDDITASFQNLSTQAGVSGDALINKFGAALGNTIPKVDLMKQANELLLGGLDPAQFELVAKAARSFGEVTGGSATEGMNALTDSLLRGNDKALKNLGIVVDNAKAYDDFAKSIGTTADKLNEEGKLLATREAVLKALAENQAKLGDVTDDAGDKIDQFTTSLQNQADEFLKAIANNKGLNLALDELVKAVQSADFKNLTDQLLSIIGTMGTLASIAIPKVISGLNTLFDVINKSAAIVSANGSLLGALFGYNDANTQAVLKAIDDTKAFNAAQDETIAKVKDFKSQLAGFDNAVTFAKTTKELDALKKAFTANVEGAQNYGVATDEVSKQIESFDKITAKAKDSITKTGKSLAESTGEVKKHGGAILTTNKTKDEAAKKEKEVEDALRRSIEAYKQYEGQIKQNLTSDEKYKELLEDLKDGHAYTADSADELREALERAKKETDLAADASDQLQAILEKLSRGIDVTDSELDTYIDSLAELEAASNAAADAQAGLKEIMNSPLGQAGGQIAGDLIDALFGGKTLKNEDYAKIAGDAAETYVSELLKDVPIIGEIAAKLANKAVEEIVKFFGGSDSAGTKARKAVDKFFAEAFEANHLAIIVNGELVKLNDLVFKGETPFGGNVDFSDGSFSQYLQSLPGEAQAAFNGVGSAFAELLGYSEELSTQLGAVLANNIGGSLNNLQLLVQATGMSFEELRGAVVKAFEDGKISAAEALSQLHGIAQVAQDGIPDGLGMVKQAFDNLKAAGTKGGRALLDALKDIGFEAKELHLKTLPEVANYLVNVAGVSADEVGKLMAALKAAGIDTIEELTSANTEKLLPALAELQNTKFPFAEASDQAKELVDSVNGLPERKSVQIDIRTNITQADRIALNQAAGINGTASGQSAF